jgi:hypothetical protein
MYYISPLPRAIFIQGRAVRGQLQFVGSDGKPSPEFGLDGHTHQVIRYGDESTICAELTVRISNNSTIAELDEIIEGRVQFTMLDAQGYPIPSLATEEHYRLHLSGTG